MTYPVYWLIGWSFCLYLNDDIVLLDFIFYKRNTIVSPMYIFLPPRILPGLIILFSSYVFSPEFSLDRIHFYAILVIGHVFILKDINVCLDISPLLIRNYCIFYSAIWCDGLVKYVSCKDLIWGMYHQYGFAHKIGACTSLLDCLT